MVQKFWRGGIQWCCKNSLSALAQEDQESSREAMGLSERLVTITGSAICKAGLEHATGRHHLLAVHQ